MKTPRGVSGDRLVRMLERLGYFVVRQKGSHIRMKHNGPPEDLVTVPRHKSINVGTLHPILLQVAAARSISIESLIDKL